MIVRFRPRSAAVSFEVRLQQIGDEICNKLGNIQALHDSLGMSGKNAVTDDEVTLAEITLILCCTILITDKRLRVSTIDRLFVLFWLLAVHVLQVAIRSPPGCTIFGCTNLDVPVYCRVFHAHLLYLFQVFSRSFPETRSPCCSIYAYRTVTFKF